MRLLGEEVTMEHGLILLFLGASLYMYIDASSEIGFWILTIDTGEGFRTAAAIFPRMTAGASIIFATLLLFRNYLPEPLHTFVAEPVRVMDKPGVEEVEDEEVATETGDSFEEVQMEGPAVTAAMSIAYLGVALLIGLLWATPMFVLAYTLYTRQPWYSVAILTVASFVIAYIFMTVLFLPLDGGILIDGVLS